MKSSKRRLRRASARTVASFVVLGVAAPLLSASPAQAEAQRPGNAAALLASGNEAPGATVLPGGAGQAGSSGDFSYAYPISVPPGRMGQQPSVALQYSSAGAVHGGVAAGWSLPVSSITVDPQAGTVASVSKDGGSATSPRNFVGPQGEPLVKDVSLPVGIGGQGYRSLNDASFTRFEYLGGVSGDPHWWKAFASDGSVSKFGLKSKHPYSYAPLVSQVDKHGHELHYDYKVVGRNSDTVPADGVPREFLLNRIDYLAPGQGGATGLPYAYVSFEYAAPSFCGQSTKLPAVGSALDYKFGFGKLSGTRKLNFITTWTARGTAADPYASYDKRREYGLNYTAADNCTNAVTPFRELSSVQEKAFAPDGAVTVLPPSEFTYGQAASYVKDSDYHAPVTISGVKTPESVDTNPVFPYGAGQNLVAPTGRRTSTAKFGAIPGDGIAEIPKKGSQLFYTLAWQLSQAQASGESVTRTWIDIDGDNRMDYLQRSGSQMDLSNPNSPTTGGCKVDVYLNKGTAGFVLNDAGFRNFSLRDAMADIPVPGSVGATGAGELLCSLNRSFSASASGYGGDASRPCPTVGDWGAPASWGSWQQVRHGFIDIDGDGRPELVSQPIASVHCPYASTSGVSAPSLSVADDNDWQTEYKFHDPTDGTTVVPVTKRQNFWYVYKNTGTGFETTPTKITAGWKKQADGTLPDATVRVPEAGFLGEFTARRNTLEPLKSTQASVQDINGDGFIDFLHEGGFVIPGRKGGFSDVSNVVRLSGAESTDIVPAYDKHSDDCNVEFEDFVGYLDSGVRVDVNGDGLPDRVTKNDPNDRCAATRGTTGLGTKVFFNTGAGFGTDAADNAVMFSEGALDTEDLSSFHVKEDAYDWQGYPVITDRSHRARMNDLDYDGLPDLLAHKPGGQSKLYLNGGRQWVVSANADAAVAASLAGRAHLRGPDCVAGASVGQCAIKEFADRGDYRHTLSQYAMDINGDGLLDLVEDSNDDGNITVRHAKQVINASVETNAPARLMRTVKNGYGATTRVTYARSVPAQKWVAIQIDSNAGRGVSMSAKHAYRLTTHKPGPYGQRIFRGFGEVRTLQVGDSGTSDDLTTVDLYDFESDPRGLPSRTAKVLGEGVFDDPAGFNPATTPGVMSLVDHEYRVRSLNLRAPGMPSDALSRVVMPEKTTSYTCTGTAGQTAANCEASAPALEEKTNWSSRLDSDSNFIMDLPSSTEQEFVNGEGKTEKRLKIFQHNVAWSPSVFNVAPKSTQDKRVINLGATNEETILGNVEYVYHDADFRLLFTQTVKDPQQPDRVSRYGYYTSAPKTGQIRQQWQPKQLAKAPSAGFTEFDYDAYGVHAKRVTNPLGHTATSETDLATGTTVKTEGPDYVCADGNGDGHADPATACSFNTAASRAKTQTTIDGLGRTKSITVFGPGDTTGATVEDRTYNDAAYYNSGGSTLVSYQVRRDNGDNGQGTMSSEVDGLGRIQRTETEQQAGDRIVLYGYNGRGQLARLKVPNAAAPALTVELATFYDALGRKVTINETDGSGQIFEQHVYNGLVHTLRQGPTTDGSRIADTRVLRDAAGQIVSVSEKTHVDEEEGEIFATTSYQYDGSGRVQKVTAPDGVITDMVHDFSGNRTSITTAGRTWSYGYDLNGNMTSIIEPLPTGATAANYTHTVDYDDLNRILKETPAVRDLTAAEREEFKIGPKEYHYDQAHDSLNTAGQNRFQVGRLSYTTSPITTLVNRYNKLGQPDVVQQSLEQITGASAFDRLKLTSIYDTSGVVLRDRYEAFPISGGSATHVGALTSYNYDPDGQVKKVTAEIAGSDLTVADLTRNGAGVVTQRLTNTANRTGFSKPTFSYGYDRHGRVISLIASDPADPTTANRQRYKQETEYFENGEVKLVREQLGTASQPVSTTNYTYDHRHQLTSATQTGGVGYFGQFTYTQGGRLDSANVAALGGHRVPVRNVGYRYNPGDPQQLDALRKRGDGTDLASYQYDKAGNTTRRALPDGTAVTQTWDGPRLRKVTKATGEKEIYFYDGSTRVAAARYTSSGAFVDVRRWFGDLEVHQAAGQSKQYRQHVQAGSESVARIDGPASTATIEHYLSTPQGHQVLALAGNSTLATPRRISSYGPFGELLTEQVSNPAPGKYTREFNGKDYDPTGGLHYYGHRYYDPLSLQWTSADPKYRFAPEAKLIEPRRANLYTYTSNNPVGMRDLDGLDTDFLNSVLTWVTDSRMVIGQNGNEPIATHRAGVVEGNATNVEASLYRGTRADMPLQVDVGHLESTIYGDRSAETLLVTINEASRPDLTTGGVDGGKVEIGLGTSNGLISGGRVMTYTTRDGDTFEAAAADTNGSDEDVIANAINSAMALRELNLAKERDRERQLDIDNGVPAGPGTYAACVMEYAECGGSSHAEPDIERRSNPRQQTRIPGDLSNPARQPRYQNHGGDSDSLSNLNNSIYTGR